MKFREGDKVEFIYRNKRSEGVINGVYPETQEVSVKQSDSPIDLLFSDKAVAKVEEPELVVVPQCVDDWFIFCTSVGYDLANALYIVKGHMPVAIYEWLQNNNDNQELLARAWMDGYEVEKEPLYYVHFLAGTGGYLNMRYDGLIRIRGKDQTDEYKTQFTEAEIKAMDERYWQFAVPVKEVEA
ncbi:DUF1642 domain-containing protein [Listeria innocua]|nr:DUF1642 domain-containing protein [Listeria innocua]EIS4930507.1 DUF1642 domain-containing protein [Listeria innocua]EIS4933532.1 DUF1642 domain-containing protein [Listeria innocua]EIS4942098.1 DUF1642 domain-containing protein [Listeria innocua]EIS4943920.1 DUF1642 domain-containing protein [Listeria innocua]